MCGVEPDYVGNVVEAIKKLKKGELDEKLTYQLYHVMKKLEAVIEARPKVEIPDSPCRCGCNVMEGHSLNQLDKESLMNYVLE